MSPDSPVLGPSKTVSSASSHLSYPSLEAEASTSTSIAPSPPSCELLKNRLYVGNLHPTVDEYTLIQIFSKFGNLARLDFLFHKSGPLRGKPRGYAFVEYAGEADAAAALEAGNGKVLRGRHITVTYAHQAPLDTHTTSRRGPSTQQQQQQQSIHHQYHHHHSDSGRPTTLSLLKSAPTTRTKTDDKIAQMEAKLQQLAQAPPTGTQPSAPAHPSLPAKPGTRPQQSAAKTAPVPAPSIPPPLPRVRKPPSLLPAPPPAPRIAPPRKGNAGLKGVKIMRRKDKVKDEGAGGEVNETPGLGS